jgi:hypothetical protein
MFSRFAMAMRWNDTVNMEEMAQVFVDAYVTREGFRAAVEIALEVANISDHVVLNLDINCNPIHRVLFLLHMYRSQCSRRGPTWELPSITSSTFSSRYCTTLPMLQHCSSLYMYTACSLKRTGSPTWEPGSRRWVTKSFAVFSKDHIRFESCYLHRLVNAIVNYN